jgi:putative phosphoesterase
MSRANWQQASELWSVPLTIGVVSDTHLHADAHGGNLPRPMLDELVKARVKLILHAGDIFAPWVLDQLGEIAPILAVTGNGDPPELRRMLPLRRLVVVGEHSIGLVHGHQGKGQNAVQRARLAFADNSLVRCVVFGHSHQPLSRLEPNGLILFNPGSPIDRRGAPYYSFGLLRVAETIEPELVYFL